MFPGACGLKSCCVINRVKGVRSALVDRGGPAPRRRARCSPSVYRFGLKAIKHGAPDLLRTRAPQLDLQGATGDDFESTPDHRALHRAGELDFRTSIHDHVEPAILGNLARLVVHDTQLQPQMLRTDPDSVRSDGRRVRSLAKHVHHLHIHVVRDVIKGSEDCLSNQHVPSGPGIYRDDPEALAL